MSDCAAPGCKRLAVKGPFCEQHAKAPPAQRGGWVSAARRRPYDATPVAPRLWLGSKPPADRDLTNVDIVVLCAYEYQPERMAFHGTILRCPIDDDVLEAEDLQLVMQTSVAVARAILDGRRVLVTCQMGLNRSAFVVALALHQLTTMGGDQIISHIRKHRGQKALFNPWFATKIKEIVGDGRPKQRRRQAG